MTEPKIEQGEDYTRLKPAIQNVSEALLKAEPAQENKPDDVWYIWTRYFNGHSAEIFAGVGKGLRVLAPASYPTPDSEIRMALVREYRNRGLGIAAARERAATANLICAEIRRAGG